MNIAWHHVLWVALGGGLGAVSRFLVTSWINEQTTSTFPWPTLTVNFLGSVLFGVLFVVVFANHPQRELLRLLVLVGFLGSFTTFSTFSFETVRLLESGLSWVAMANILGSVLSCVLGLWVGMGVARLAS